MYTRAVPEEGDRAYFAPLRICLRREAGQPTAVLELSAILFIVPFCTRPHSIPLRVRFVVGQRAGIMKLKRTRPCRVSSRSARTRRSAGQPSVKAVSAVSLVLPTASRVRRLSISMSLPALATTPKTRRAPKPRFDIANPDLQMPLTFRAAPDEGRIQGHHNCRRCCFRPDRDTIPRRLADLQGMAAQGFMMLSRVDRESLLQYIRGGPFSHEGTEMRLQSVQLRRRPAMRWPVDVSVDPATCGTAKPGRLLLGFGVVRRGLGSRDERIWCVSRNGGRRPARARSFHHGRIRSDQPFGAAG